MPAQAGQTQREIVQRQGQVGEEGVRPLIGQVTIDLHRLFRHNHRLLLLASVGQVASETPERIGESREESVWLLIHQVAEDLHRRSRCSHPLLMPAEQR
jgi:hypothetical protein